MLQDKALLTEVHGCPSTRHGDSRLGNAHHLARTVLYGVKSVCIRITWGPLLGTNALWENGLVIDAYNEILYSSPAKAGGRTCVAALQCKTGGALCSANGAT